VQPGGSGDGDGGHESGEGAGGKKNDSHRGPSAGVSCSRNTIRGLVVPTTTGV
jgi:hypothetical protein